MELLDLLTQSQTGNNLGAIGAQLGLDEQQTATAMQQLAPIVAAGLRRNMASSPDGVVNLVQALQKGNHSQYLDEPENLRLSDAASDGNAILGHVFGSKDVSRAVAMQAASSSGIGSSVLKKLLPVVATMVLGSVAKKMMGGGATAAPAPRQQTGGGLGDILGQVLGGGSSRGGGGLGDILGQVLGGGSSRRSRTRAPQPHSGGLDDLLSDMLGGDDETATGSGGYNEDVIGRSRSVLDDFLGGSSSTGNAADDLLNSVERHLRR